MAAEPIAATHCLNCVRMARQLEAMRIDLENAEVDLRVARTRYKTAEGKLLERRREAPERALAQGVFDYWNLVCRNGKAREFTGKRLENVLARLKHNHVVFLLGAIEGAASDPFVDSKGKVFDDLELICRDAAKLDSFIERCEIEKRRLRAEVHANEYPRWVARHMSAFDPVEAWEARWQQIVDKSCEVTLMDTRPIEPKERTT